MPGKKITKEEVARIIELCEAKTPFDSIRETIKTEFNVLRPNSTFYNNYRRHVRAGKVTTNA